MQTEGRQCENTGRRWPSTSHGEGPLEETSPVDTLSQISSPENCAKINFCCLSRAVCGTWLWQPQQTDTPSLSIVSRELKGPEEQRLALQPTQDYSEGSRTKVAERRLHDGKHWLQEQRKMHVSPARSWEKKKLSRNTKIRAWACWRRRDQPELTPSVSYRLEDHVQRILNTRGFFSILLYLRNLK